mgnify:CR=1 FL=1
MSSKRFSFSRCAVTSSSTIPSGIGISKENLEKIFKTFYRVQDEDSNGEGLGLTIANRIVEKHEGLIDVESEEGQGCRFIISLPVYKDDVKQEGPVNE